jgi:signal transduction histidine kinase
VGRQVGAHRLVWLPVGPGRTWFFAFAGRVLPGAIQRFVARFSVSTPPAWLDQAPSRALLLLDGSIVLGLVLTFAQLGDADVQFHVVWTLLVVYAFTSPRLAPVLIRVAVSMAILIVYVLLPDWGLPVHPLEFAEWPLMLLISVIVAVMAEWRRSTSSRYANLYRLASERLLTAQEAERKRLALELHDGVGQTLSSLGLALESVAEGLPGRPELRTARELLASATQETRDVAGRLQPIRLGERGLVSAVRELIRRAGIPAEFVIAPESIPALEALPVEAQLNLYRIVQEGLANAVRHSGASKVAVTFARNADGIDISISDNGHGFDPAAAEGAGLGLAGIRDRARVVGAAVRILSANGAGTTIALLLPLMQGVSAVGLEAVSQW